MKKLFYCILILGLISCNNQKAKTELLEKENELLKRELELISMESNVSDTVLETQKKVIIDFDYKDGVIENVAYASNSSFTIRIDYLNGGRLRYLSWKKPLKITDKPSLVLYDGYHSLDDSNWDNFVFTNNNFQYNLNCVSRDSPIGRDCFLEIFENDNNLTRQSMFHLYDD